jgi:two-component system response regulator MprA
LTAPEPEAQTRATLLMSTSAPHTQHRVLIVDDHPDIRETLAIVMELRGLQPVTAASGGEALARLAEPSERPCVVLLDINMPDLDGWQVRERMRADPDLAEVPVVLLTGNYVDVERARRLGIRGYLRKPIDVHEIEDAIEQYCEFR